MKPNGRCPVCSTAYSFQNIKVLGEKDQQVLTYIQCSHCGSGVISVLSVNPFGLKASGMITDLSAEEIMDSEEDSEVTENDVMDVHELMDEEEQINELLNRSNK